MDQLLLRLLDPATRSDPYPLYAAVREAGPARLGDGSVAVFARHAEGAALLRHPQTSNDRRHATLFTRMVASPAGPPALFPVPLFLFLDPPDHTRLRRLVAGAFTPRMVERLGPRIAAITDGLLDAAAAAGHFDVVADLAAPLPVTVISELLGVPEGDREMLRRWSGVLTRALDPVLALTGRPAEGLDDRLAAMTEFQDYLRELAARRRRDPADDLVTALVEAEDAGDRLTEDELVSTCVLLLIAGHETTVSLISNAVLALLRQPDELGRLTDDPTLAANAVEETLRYDPPVHLVARVATADLEVAGLTVPAGTLVLILLAAAGRDPEVNPEPDRFDLARPDPHHLAFGLGPHFCLGASLARIEAVIALDRFVRRVRGPRLATDDPPYKDAVTLRGLAALPIDYEQIDR